MKLFDTHAHLTDERFSQDLPEVMARMEEAGVELCVVVGDGTLMEQQAITLAQAHPGLYAATGVHPHDASEYTSQVEDRLREWMGQPKMVALGETGLDYHYDHSPRETQRQVFKAQLDLAYELDKPVILHVRDAHGDALSILTAQRDAGRMPRGVMHCYSGSYESARQYMNLGLYISFAGPVTFKNAHILKSTAAKIPLDRILIETDCPYLAPEPVRGRRNEPGNVRHIAHVVAELREMDAEAFALAAYENGKALFGIGGV